MFQTEIAGGIAAGNWLRFAFGEDYPEVIDSIYDEELLKQASSEKIITDQSFKLYPNPASGLVYIELQNVDLICNNILTVYDITGKAIKLESLRNDFNMSCVDLTGIEAGIYFFEVTCNENLIGVQKLMIE